jgi:hypothetical protein
MQCSGEKAVSINPSIALTLALLLFSAREAECVLAHIPTSEALKVARIIARDEGYDIRNTKLYYFDSLDSQAPFIAGYVSIGFYVNGNVRSGISISETTGQALDMTTCEIFDYPELRPFQERILRLSKARRKTPRELADEVGCDPPRVLTKPVPYAKEK